jgi:hypothetical protein
MIKQGDISLLLSENKRKIALTVISILTLCSFVALFVFNRLTPKTAMLYVFTLCLILLIIFWKNSINKYGVTIFCLLVVELISCNPQLNGGSIGPSFVLSYRYGLSSQGLIPTVIDIIFHGRFISKAFVWHFVFTSTLFLCFLLSCLAGQVIQTAAQEIRPFAECLALVYLSCFASPSA